MPLINEPPKRERLNAKAYMTNRIVKVFCILPTYLGSIPILSEVAQKQASRIKTPTFSELNADQSSFLDFFFLLRHWSNPSYPII